MITANVSHVRIFRNFTVCSFLLFRTTQVTNEECQQAVIKFAEDHLCYGTKPAKEMQITKTMTITALHVRTLFRLKNVHKPRHVKTKKVTVHLAKTQISLGICPVWSESSLCAQWVAKNPSFLRADSEVSDQTGRMPRLTWVFAGRTATLLVLSCRGSPKVVVIWNTSRHWKTQYSYRRIQVHLWFLLNVFLFFIWSVLFWLS